MAGVLDIPVFALDEDLVAEQCSRPGPGEETTGSSRFLPFKARSIVRGLIRRSWASIARFVRKRFPMIGSHSARMPFNRADHG